MINYRQGDFTVIRDGELIHFFSISEHFGCTSVGESVRWRFSGEQGWKFCARFFILRELVEARRADRRRADLQERFPMLLAKLVQVDWYIPGACWSINYVKV